MAGSSSRSIETLAPNPVRGALWMVLAMVISGVTLLSLRELWTVMAVIEIVFFRHLFGLVLCLPWLIHKGPAALKTTHLPMYWVRALCALCGGMAWAYAVGAMHLADAVAINFTLPLFAIVLAILFLGERVGLHRGIATLVGFAGVLVILRPGVIEFSLPAMLALAAALSGATANTLIKILVRSETPGLIIFYMHAMVTGLAAIPVIFFWTTPGLADLPWLVGVAVGFTTSIYCRTRALALAETTAILPLEFIRLPLAAAIGFILFAEISGVWTWVGAAIIFTSTSYITRHAAMTAR